MKLNILKGSTDVTVYVFVQDSSSTTGAGLTGLLFNTASLTATFARPLTAAASLTLVTQTVTGAHTDGGFVEVSSSLLPGVYRLDLSDTIIASGVDSVVAMLKGAANMAPLPLEIQLVSYDPNDAASLGLSNLNATVSSRMAEASINTTGGKVDGVISNDDMRGTDGANTVVPPSVSQFNARTLVAADYFDPAADTVANVTLVATTTTNSDMVGTDNAALASALSTVDGKIDDIQGATFSTSTDSLEAIRNRGDAAWTTGAGGSAPTVEEIRIEMDDNSTKLATIATDTTTDIPAQISGLNNIAATDIVSAGAITTLSGAVVNVDLVDVTTANSDMVGTNGANTVTPDNTGIAAIQAKTDDLTFTKANELDSNVQSVNGTEVVGDGGSGTEWGPV